MQMQYKTGSLVAFRDRPWVVQQSGDEELMLLKPLGGTDAETIELYLPLYGDSLDIRSYNFRRPSTEDIGKNSYRTAAQLLYNACRLSFRNIAGPFQCLGKLSVEPRPYQMVPLILALKHETIRLLISDDVGIGKTLESLLIAKELLDRGEISRFAVVCLPHLCEQWQNEIKDKFGLDAEIIRSSTISRLEKRLRPDQNVFRDIPYQVISIDYIKQDGKRSVFLDHCPDFIIVDEAHTCARPTGANKYQQQRYRLLREIADKPGQQLVLLTATPHSGQNEEFLSLIGLLDRKFEDFDLKDRKEREELSHYFIQRRRSDIQKYLGEGESVFPERERQHLTFSYPDEYLSLLDELLKFVKEGIKNVLREDRRKQRYVYWDLIGLMRSIMSSPDAGISMLQNKIDKQENLSQVHSEIVGSETEVDDHQLSGLMNADDLIPEVLESTSRSEKRVFRGFIQKLSKIKEDHNDEKVKQAFSLVCKALESHKDPIVFCQYIQTAEYVGEYMSRELKKRKGLKDVAVGIVTSKLADEERKVKIEALAQEERHLLVCTDCLSEGVNLQEGFEAVIHYDLPWNPNRMEQRNGRIDRFGQTAPSVAIYTLQAENNPVDDIVLNVLYRKQEEIRKRIGVYLPIADDDASLMETITERIMEAQVARENVPKQNSLFQDDEEYQRQIEEEVKETIQTLEEEEKISRTYYAHNTKQMDPSRLTASLREARSVIGGVEDTRDFIIQQLQHMRVTVQEDSPLCYSFALLDLPSRLRHYFAGRETTRGVVRISFASPTPKGYVYIGRNHLFTEDLSRAVINDSINGGELGACRAMVLETNLVTTRTTILLMRVRSVIRDTKTKAVRRELVGEEMIFVAYRGDIEEGDLLTQEEAKELFMQAQATGDIDLTTQRMLLGESISWISDEETLRRHTDPIARERASRLVKSYARYRIYLQEGDYQVATPVLPMDVIAAYLYVPTIKK